MTMLGMLALLVIFIGGLIWQKKIFEKDTDSDKDKGWVYIVFNPVFLLFFYIFIHTWVKEDFDEAKDEAKIGEVFEEAPTRVLIPVLLGWVFLIGMILYCSFSMIVDNNSRYTLSGLLDNSWKILVLIYTTSLKTYFGAVFSTISLAYFSYNYFEYGVVKIWDFLNPFFDWVFSRFPEGVSNAYEIILTILVFGGTLLDSFNNNWLEDLFN